MEHTASQTGYDSASQSLDYVRERFCLTQGQVQRKRSIMQVHGGDDNLGAMVNGREDTVKLEFNLADATMKTSADGHHVEVSFKNDASTLKTLSNVEAVQFNDAMVRIIGADGYKDVAEATNTSNVSHVNVGVDAVFVSVASGYDALVQHASVVDLNNTYTALSDAYNHHG